MAGVPVTLPPTSSVSLRRLLAIGEGFRASVIRRLASVSLVAQRMDDKQMTTGRLLMICISIALEMNFAESAKRASSTDRADAPSRAQRCQRSQGSWD